MNADGTEQTRLTVDLISDSFPDWGGSKIVLASTISGSMRAALWLVNPDGTGTTKLTDTLTNHMSPSWSPDGSKFA